LHICRDARFRFSSNADGKPVTLFRKYPGWTAVFSSACLLPVEAVRALARDAGAPAYSDHKAARRRCPKVARWS
jgi:cytolysin (calcineurin-like family phosphatase)